MSHEFLWVVPKWPIPPDDGARLATFNLLRGLTAAGAQVDLVVLAGESEQVNEEDAKTLLGVRSVRTIVRPDGGTSTLRRSVSIAFNLLRGGRLPITMRSYADPAVVRELDEVVGRTEWRYLVYDGLHPCVHAAATGEFRKPANVSKVIYRAHNREADLWFRMAEQSRLGLKRKVLTGQAEKVRRLEDSLAASACVAAVSEEDLRIIRQAVPGVRGRAVPIGYEFGQVEPVSPQSEPEVLFLGRLDWYPNRDGLRWFLTRIWPKVAKRRADLRLLVAGSGNPGSLRSLLSGPRIDFLGRVGDVRGLYGRCALCVVPVFYGSGTRVKVIEASRFARPCLSTALGVEGVGLEAGLSYFRAETEADWIEVLCSYDLNRGAEIGMNAYHQTQRRFGLHECAAEFLALADEVASSQC